MTKLKTPIRRETSAYYQTRPLIIQLELIRDGLNYKSIVKVKEKGRKTWYTVSVEDIFSLGAKKYAQAILKKKQEDCSHKTVKYGRCRKCKKLIPKKYKTWFLV